MSTRATRRASRAELPSPLHGEGAAADEGHASRTQSWEGIAVSETIISAEVVEKNNAARKADLERDYAIARRAARPPRHRDRRDPRQGAKHSRVAIPSWGVGTGGTRFARFPGAGEPRDIFDKIEDCAVIQQLTRATPTVSLHIPWDKADPNRLKQAASRFGLGFDAMNSNTFSDAQGPEALLQVRLARPRRCRHAPAGGRAQSRMHRDRQDARLQGADGLDRRRLELPRPGQFRQGLRALSRRR